MRAFVLSGGAAHGSMQVGMLQALQEFGVVPDILIGTSVGALNGGWISADYSRESLQNLANVWLGLKRSDIFPTHFGRGLSGFVGRADHLCPDSGLRALLKRHLRLKDLGEGHPRLHVVATELLSGKGKLISKGSAIDAICASAAIPGIFPPVSIDGTLCVDGGLVANAPLAYAVQAGATDIWVLSCGHACMLRKAPQGALGVALQALSIAIDRQLDVDLERFSTSVDIHMPPPLCPVDSPTHDFSKSSELMSRAYVATTSWLASGAHTDIACTTRHAHEH